MSCSSSVSTSAVENTGGDDLEQVEVSLTSNGPAAISTINETNELPSGSSGDFVFEVSSAAVGVEILTAAIQRAVSVNTGQEVPPIQAVESTENLQVQIAAVLSCDMSITSPQGAVDDTVSAGQMFELTAIVSNLGEASDDGSGRLTLDLPSGFGRAYPDADSLVRSFSMGDEIVWTIIAPSAPSTVPAQPVVSISRVPRDINIGTTAFVQKASDGIYVVTEEAAGSQSCGLLLASPSGATDGILSTGQEFVIMGSFTPSANSALTWAELSVPAGFTITGDARRQTGDGGGLEIQVEWTVSRVRFPGIGRAGGHVHRRDRPQFGPSILRLLRNGGVFSRGKGVARSRSLHIGPGSGPRWESFGESAVHDRGGRFERGCRRHRHGRRQARDRPSRRRGICHR